MTISQASLQSRRRRGFTLVEMMIGAVLGSIALAGVLSTFLMLLRSGVRAGNYQVMEMQIRRGIEQFAIDSRMANGIVTGTNSVTLIFSANAVPASYAGTSDRVTYAMDSTNKWFYLVPGDGTSLTNQKVLVHGVTALTYNRYDANGVSTTSDSVAKHVQVAITVTAAQQGVVTQNETVVSAEFTMRNKL